MSSTRTTVLVADDHPLYREAVSRAVSARADLDGPTVYAAVAGGAGAYLSKSSSSDRICDAIAAVARGEVVLPAEIQAGLAAQIQTQGRPAGPQLTPREGQVLGLIAQGLSAPAIGRELHLSTATIKTHLRTLYEKLGVSDRAAAVAEAMRMGLLD